LALLFRLCLKAFFADFLMGIFLPQLDRVSQTQNQKLKVTDQNSEL